MPYLKNISYLNWKAKMSALKILIPKAVKPYWIVTSDPGRARGTLMRHGALFGALLTPKMQMKIT